MKAGDVDLRVADEKVSGASSAIGIDKSHCKHVLTLTPCSPLCSALRDCKQTWESKSSTLPLSSDTDSPNLMTSFEHISCSPSTNVFSVDHDDDWSSLTGEVESKKSTAARCNRMPALRYGGTARNCLFMFRRQIGQNEVRERTVFARDGETMKILIKRLQRTAKQVLTFTKSDAKDIAAGDKHIVFCLHQMKMARFVKHEFGSMLASDLLALTDERPIMVELLAQDSIVDGETIDIF